MALTQQPTGKLSDQLRHAKDEAGEVRGELSSIAADLRELLKMETELARAETDEAKRYATRGATFGAAGAVLALITTGELASFGNADRQITQEGLAIKRLDRELAYLGEEGQQGRKLLRGYVESVTMDEWPRLARRPQSLSPAAEQNLGGLWTEVRRLQPLVKDSNPGVGAEINDNLRKIEEARLSRFSASVNGRHAKSSIHRIGTTTNVHRT